MHDPYEKGQGPIGEAVQAGLAAARGSARPRVKGWWQCPDGFICAEEAAQILKVSKRTLSNWQKHKVVPYYKLGHFIYFKRDELFAVIEKSRVPNDKLTDGKQPPVTPKLKPN